MEMSNRRQQGTSYSISLESEVLFEAEKIIRSQNVEDYDPGVSNLQPSGCVQLRMAVNTVQHKIVILLKTLRGFFVIMCHNVFNVWPKTTLLLPVWPRASKRLDTPKY